MFYQFIGSGAPVNSYFNMNHCNLLHTNAPCKCAVRPSNNLSILLLQQTLARKLMPNRNKNPQMNAISHTISDVYGYIHIFRGKIYDIINSISSSLFFFCLSLVSCITSIHKRFVFTDYWFFVLLFSSQFSTDARSSTVAVALTNLPTESFN